MLFLLLHTLNATPNLVARRFEYAADNLVAHVAEKMWQFKVVHCNVHNCADHKKKQPKHHRMSSCFQFLLKSLQRGQKIGNSTLSTFFSIHNSKQMKMARSQCNCFAGLELKRCHMPRTRDRKVGMKEIQQWLIRKSYESETYPLSSVHQETNQTNFLLENLRNFLLENLLNFLLENLRSFLLENLRLSVQSRILWVETHC